jgi:YbbR domain-containing protein
MKRHQWQLKFVALIAAVIIWAIIVTYQKSEVTCVARIKVNLPKTHVVVEQSVQEVNVTLNVSRSLMRAYSKQNQFLVVVDIPNPSVGMMFHRVVPANIVLPKAAQVVAVSPRDIVLEIDQVASKTVPVLPQFMDNHESGFKVAEYAVQPSSVNILGPASSLKKIARIELENISLHNRKTSFAERNVQAVTSKQKFWLEKPEEFTVNVKLEEGFDRRILNNVTIRVETHSTLRSEIYPSSLSQITLYGNRQSLQNIRSDQIQVTKDLSSYVTAQTIQTKLTSENINLPSQIRLVDFEPKNFVVKLYKKE